MSPRFLDLTSPADRYMYLLLTSVIAVKGTNNKEHI